MKKYMKFSSLCFALMLPAAMLAQTSIDFETENYKRLGVYDTWEESPFRTNKLQGNVKVVDNFINDETNPTEKILGIQRSRFGSNTFGARIDLNDVIHTSSNLQYAHVLMYKPVESRVMLIGLGKRTDRADQSAEVEQFWAIPVTEPVANEWFDAVFPVKTNDGVEIHSLVIVPDCETPHNLKDDFAVYVDEIVFNDNIKPRIGGGYYTVNYSKDAAWSRNDRKINSVKLSSSDGNQTVTIPNQELTAYMERLETPFLAKPGETVTPSFDYAGEWMHGYVYLDKGNDGDFSFGVLDGDYLDKSTDLVAYSFYSSAGNSTGKNSAGSTASNGNKTIQPPTFTIPADLPVGMYRMRYKIDWNNIDAGGCVDNSNNIISNGGGIVDVMLNVHGDYCNVKNDNRNGYVEAADGSPLDDYKAPFGQSLTVRMVPANGFSYNGIRVRHGYNLTGDSLVKTNPQYHDEIITLEDFNLDDNTCVIPARFMDGDVLIEGLFVEEGHQGSLKKVTYHIFLDGNEIDTQEFSVASGAEYPYPSITTETSPEFYTFSGIPDGVTTDEDEEIDVSVVQTLPFSISSDFANASWYNISITANKNYLRYAESQPYIPLNSTVFPEKDDLAAQWAFVGNILEGFAIINREAGDTKVLSSSTAITSNNDGTTYPIMVNTPVPDSNNTYWIPTSSNLLGEGGFFLHQLGYVNNCMNSRNDRLAYWIGGADSGSTFLATLTDTSSGINSSFVDEDSSEYFNLQGIKVNIDNCQSGVYILRKGNTIDKLQIVH